MRFGLSAAVFALISPAATGCGSSSSDGAGGAGGGAGGPGISCDDPAPRVTATPTTTPPSVPVGKSTAVDFAIPVTRAA